MPEITRETASCGLLGLRLDLADAGADLLGRLGGLVGEGLHLEATTAKPRPTSPARAASMVALRASSLVWPAMLETAATTSEMLLTACTSSFSLLWARRALSADDLGLAGGLVVRSATSPIEAACSSAAAATNRRDGSVACGLGEGFRGFADLEADAVHLADRAVHAFGHRDGVGDDVPDQHRAAADLGDLEFQGFRADAEVVW